MTVQFIGKSANQPIGLLDEYRLTYVLSGSFFGFDDVLNASAIELRLYRSLPLVGLTVRSTPQAITGDSVVVIRVQPNDIMAGSTVAQMADRADFSGVDFTLGLDAFTLGLNIDLTKVEYLGVVSAKSTLPSGTSPLGSDSTARVTEQENVQSNDLVSQLKRAGIGFGILALVLVVAFLYVKAED